MDTLNLGLVLTAFVLDIFLAGIVLGGNLRSASHRVFAVVMGALAVHALAAWAAALYPDLPVVKMAALAAVPLTTAAFFHFCSTLLVRTHVGSWTPLSTYALAVVAALLAATGTVGSETPSLFLGLQVAVGPTFPAYLVATYAPIAAAIVLLARDRRGARSVEHRTRVMLALAGAVAWVAGTLPDTSPFLGISFYPISAVCNILFGIATALTMQRRRLLSVRSFVRRSLAYAVVSAVIFIVYGVGFIAFSTLFRGGASAGVLLTTFAALVIVAVLIPMGLERLRNNLDRLFFRQRHDQLVALQQFSRQARDIEDLPGLATGLVQAVTQAMRAEWAALLLPNQAGDELVLAGSATDAVGVRRSIARGSVLGKWLEKNDGVLRVEDLRADPYLQAMEESEAQEYEDSGAQLFAPLKSKGTLTGVLIVGPRSVQQEYGEDDVRLLTTVTGQAATIVENSRLYSLLMARSRELQQLDELKSTLLRTVSHELKSPVTAIKVAADLLADATEPMPERNRQRLISTLQNGVNRLERVIAESLDYSAMQSAQLHLNIAPVELSDLLEGIVALAKPPIAAKEQSLTISVEPGLPLVPADGARVERVLLNLLGNANKHTPPGTDIRLSVRRHEGMVLFEVSDNGPGIPANDVKYIFNEYYRGSKPDQQKGTGSGLGLAIAKAIVEMHGGTIWVDTKVDTGTTFRFTLPLTRPEEEHRPAGPRPPAATANVTRPPKL